MANGPAERERKTFSYVEAVALMPEVRRLTEEAQARVAALREAPQVADTRSRLDEIVEGWAHRIMEKGIEVKGLWLIDFDNGSGYYCWRYPEAGLHFFHSYEDGFRGRVGIQ